MKVVEYVREFISSLDERSFYIVLSVSLSAIFFISGFIMYYTRGGINSLQEQLVEINDGRRSISILLGRYTSVKKQRQAVNAILSREKGFKIYGYFHEKVLDPLGISKNLVQDTPPITTKKDKDYEEISLTGVLNELSMKQLTDLLQKIAENELVYLKKIEIVKSESMPPSVNATLTIATLGSTEVAE